MFRKNIYLKLSTVAFCQGLWGLKPRRYLSDSSGDCSKKCDRAFAAMTKQSEDQRIAIKETKKTSQVTEFSTISQRENPKSGFIKIITLIAYLAIYGLPCWFSG